MDNMETNANVLMLSTSHQLILIAHTAYVPHLLNRDNNLISNEYNQISK